MNSSSVWHWISTTRVPDILSFSIHKTEIDNRYVVQVILCSCSHGCQTLLFLHQIKFENATYMQFICFPRVVTGICLWCSWFPCKLHLREPQSCFTFRQPAKITIFKNWWLLLHKKGVLCNISVLKDCKTTYLPLENLHRSFDLWFCQDIALRTCHLWQEEHLALVTN